MNLSGIGNAIQQMVNAAGKVLAAAEKAGIVPAERKKAKKRAPKAPKAPTVAEGDDE